MKTKNLMKHFLSIVTVCFFIIIAFGSDEEDNSLNADGTPKTERQIQIEKQFSAWDGSHRELTKVIRMAMNDADSYEHIETVYKDKNSYIFVRTTYSGKNAFGGRVKNWVSAKVDINGNIIEILGEGN